MSKIHELDTGVEEYFEFRIKGHLYRFRLPNTEEQDEMEDFSKAEDKSSKKFREMLYKFITKVDKNAPEFSELAKGLNVRYWSKFVKMVETEFTQ